MSNILKGIQLNEVSPHDYDSDWDYQDALARSGRPRSSYRSQEDDTFDSDVAYSRKIYQATKAAKEKAQRDADHNRLASGMNEEQLDELSPETLASYKKKASAAATQADKQGDYKLGNKRFSGIIKATKKQFAQDEKKLKEFAPVGGEGGEEDTLRKYAKLWYNGNLGTQQQVEKILDRMGWEIGELESEEGGAFVVQSGDENGDTYIGFTANDLTDNLDENLHKWFKEKWVRFGPDGKIRGSCARGDDSEGKPKCLPQSKAHNLGKKGRASAAARKRREDPNPERSGKAINVNTKKKSNESINEGIPSDNDMGSTPRGSKMTLGQWKQMWQKKMPNADMSLFRFPPSMPGSAIAYFDGWMNNPDARWDPQQGVAEGSDNPWGDQGNFAGDTPVNIGGVSVKKLTIGDIVSYFGQKAKILDMSKTGNTSRIHIPSNLGGVTKDVFTKDLKRTSLSEEELDEACWKGYHKEGNKKMFGKTYPNCVKNEGVVEGSEQNLSVQQLATISDEALDKAYGYGRSNPGNTFGWQANLMSAAYAKKMIDAGVTDIEKISDAIHKGWNVTAQKFVQNPDQFDDTEKLRQAGKLEAKLAQRAKLMKINYGQLDNEEQEKDRVVARALLQAIKGQQGVAESHHNETCPHCGGEMVSEELMNEKKDACYYKVKSRYKVWPSAYASGALVKCRKKGASNWGTGGKSNESIEEDQLDEKWTKKYKDSINCSNPKGFSQKAHCAGKQKNESAIMSGLNQLDEGWKEKLGAAALAGSMALGAGSAHSRVTPDGEGGFTGGLKPAPTVTAPTDNKPAAEAPSGFSKEYLQKAADPNRTGRYMISVEKAQELLKNMP